MVTSRIRGRLTAAATSALLLILGPAGAPAWADTTTTITAQPGPASWQPPPVNMAARPPIPSSKGAPDGTYTLSSDAKGCLQSNAGATVPLTQVPEAQSMLDITDAQPLGNYGSGVTVAVIDTGVNQHPYLTGRLENGGDYILSDGNALLDCDGHGTIVAGIIAANTSGHGVGFTGVAPQAKILAIKHTSSKYTDQSQNNKPAGDLHTLAQAIVYAASQSNVGVITMSVDECILAANASANYASSAFQELQAAIHWAVNDQNKVVIAAAANLSASANNSPNQSGQQDSQCTNATQNDNPNPNQVNQIQIPPVLADDVLSVASVNPLSGAVSNFSVWGPWVSVAAPGEDITSIDPGQGGSGLADQTVDDGKLTTLQGTSFAAPYVAGVVALIRAKYPTLSARAVMYRLEATAQHPSGPGGRNNQVGYGLINPVAALTAVLPILDGVSAATASPIPAQLPQDSVRDETAIRVAWLGIVIGGVILLVTYLVVRTNRHSRQRRELSN